jgi:hypothetical protein
MRRKVDDDHGSSVFTQRLRTLFDEVTQVDQHGRRRRFSNTYVAEQVDLSVSYIDALRRGEKTNPGLNVLTKLAAFFNEHRDPETPRITVSYLAGDADDRAPAEDDALLARLDDTEVRLIATRARGCSPRTRQHILDLIEVLERPHPGQEQANPPA